MSSNQSLPNTANRDEFLLNIAQKLGRDKPLTEVKRPSLRYRCHQDVMADLNQEQLKGVFKNYAETSLGAQVIETKKDKLESLLAELCYNYQSGERQESHAAEIILSASSDLLSFIQPERLAAERRSVHVWDNQAGYAENIAVAEQAKVGIVMAEQALAESGTMVLYSQPEQGRAISLLPEASIFIVAKSTLVPRLTQATARLHGKAKRGERIPSCVNFISGPSSTADIELIKVVGVHGPISATYIIIDDI